jgi:hypothetical protein
MAETDVAVRPGTEDDDELPYDLPWRLDVPALRTLRVVRRVVPPSKTPRLTADDPRLVLYRRRRQRPQTVSSRVGIGPFFRISTRTRLGLVAVMTAGLGLAGSYGTAKQALAPVSNPVPAAHVLGTAHWATAAPNAGAWTAQGVVVGRQDPAVSCAAGTLPADGSAFRRSTARAGVGEQHVTRAASPQAAEALITAWLAGVRSCERKAYGRGAVIRTLGTYPGVGDGLTVVGVFYTVKKPGQFGTRRGADLFAVGRDGRLVTTLQLDVAGAPGRIPVGPFTAVAKRALAELR